MEKPMKHHDLLIEQAAKDGWVRGYGWRRSILREARKSDFCMGEWSELTESLDFIESPHPDAWRISVEDENTVDECWNYPVVVLEFLEVEVTSGITQGKDDVYRFLWDVFDATHYFHLRIWHMDRFGVIRPYITHSTFDPMVFGMNAGWRS